MSEPDYKKFRSIFETEIRGEPGSLPIMRHSGEGIDFIPFNEKTSDITFLEGTSFYLNITASVFHMTPTEISLMNDGGTDTGRIDSNVFKRKNVLPKLAKIDQIINRQIIPEFDDQNKLKFYWIYDPDPEEKALQQQVTSERLNNGEITINEVRISKGLEPFPEEFGDLPTLLLQQGIFSREHLKKKVESEIELMDNPMGQMGFPEPPQGEQQNEPPKSKTNPAIQTEKPRGNKPENAYNKRY